MICPRCLTDVDPSHSPDEKACSDNCITRLLAQIEELNADAKGRAEAVFDRWRTQMGEHPISHSDGLRFLYALKQAFASPLPPDSEAHE